MDVFELTAIEASDVFLVLLHERAKFAAKVYECAWECMERCKAAIERYKKESKKGVKKRSKKELRNIVQDYKKIICDFVANDIFQKVAEPVVTHEGCTIKYKIRINTQ